MALSAVCLLALVALSGASKPQKCYSKRLGRFFYEGQAWTEPPCIRATCLKNGLVISMPCKLIKPGPGCMPVEGKPGAPYPHCCRTFICPKPGQCYSKGLRRFFDDGQKWTEPPCQRAVCDKGKIIRLPCGLISIPPGCKVVQGPPGAPYPSCCSKVVCPKPRRCYSKKLRRYFNDGQKWTEPPCQRASCSNGNVGVVACPLIRPGPGCVLVKGKPGAPYPRCCVSFICPKPGQCYSKGLRRFFDDGQNWTEPPCQRAFCDKGKIIGLPCGLIATAPGCKVVQGPSGAPYPICCSKVVCPKPSRCYSNALSRYFNNGEKWTEPGCLSAMCDNGRINRLPCGLIATAPGCTVVQGPPGAPYPGCCSKVVCPKPSRCYSNALSRYFNNGEKWTEPGCLRAMCDNGRINRLPCGLIVPAPGCKVVQGPPGAPYPSCCSKVVCPKPGRCYSKVLRRYFNNGHEWREPPCARAKCIKGRIVRRPCWLKLGHGCKGAKGKSYICKGKVHG